MLICSDPRCQTAAGCVCNRTPIGAWVVPAPPPKTPLCEYTDEEIANEYRWRVMRKLGDPSIGVQGHATPSPLGG